MHCPVEDYLENYGRRIKPLLHRFISNNQGAFMPGRRANDDVVITKEIVNMTSQRHRKWHICALKLDVHKAYDTISWNFLLKACLLNLGFSSQFVTVIMQCVSSISFQVRVNKGYSDVIVPSHSSRQSDPISPYLYLICGRH